MTVYKFSLDASKSNAIYGRSATVPVSYTHLDVYKRQAILPMTFVAFFNHLKIPIVNSL